MNAAQLARTVGLTYRQVDHWTRAGYLQPINPNPGEGQPRAYPQSEVDVAASMKALTAAGMEAAAAHRIARGDQNAADRLIGAVLAAVAPTDEVDN